MNFINPPIVRVFAFKGVNMAKGKGKGKGGK